MKLRSLVLMVLCAMFALPRPASAITDEQVDRKIKELIEGLYRLQNSSGHWDTDSAEEGHSGLQHGGWTALATYALLTAGESYQNPRLTKAIDFLKRVEMKGVYAVGLRAHVWAALPPQFDRLLQKDVYWLLQAQHPQKGHFNYSIKAGEGYDNSVTQYGVLGVWEGAKRGQAVGKPFWEKAENHFLKFQHDNGGWDYSPGTTETRGSMTAAGLACLYITQDFLHNQDYRAVGRAKDHALQGRINKGLDWFVKNFQPNKNPGGGGSTHYYLYGVERVGLASGVKYFGGKNWYESGAEFLLNGAGKDSVDMSFSLLFLVRGRDPIFMNKLEIANYHWNNRPRDLANLALWVSDEVEKKMLWQVVHVDTPAEDWLDAPILYVASHVPLTLDEKQEQQLKRYIDLGGLLITTADDSNADFTKSVKDLMAKLYPQYKFADVDPRDELMNVVFQITDPKFKVQTLHNGVRHMVLHLPSDVSWTLHSSNQSDTATWQFFTNAFYYATEKGQNRNRLDAHFIARGKEGGGPKITIGVAEYDGNWNPEPLAWEVQGNFMFNASKADLSVKTVDLANLPAPKEVALVHVRGTTRTTFSQQQIEAIRKYTAAGGTVLFENVGGRGEFAQGVMEMLGQAMPRERVRPVSLQTPVVTGEGITGYDLAKVDYRPYTLLRMGKIEVPRLLSVNVGDHPRILISGEDITYALLRQPAWGVFGYSTDSAQKLIANVVLNAHYAVHGPPKPPAPKADEKAAPKADAKKTPEKKPAEKKPADEKPDAKKTEAKAPEKK